MTENTFDARWHAAKIAGPRRHPAPVPVRRRPLTINRALDALRRRGLDYRADHSSPGAWHAECPRCHRWNGHLILPLRLEDRDGRLDGACRAPDCGRAALVYLIEPTDLEHARLRRRQQQLADQQRAHALRDELCRLERRLSA